MSVNLIRTLSLLNTRPFLRRIATTTVAIMSVLWSAHSHSQIPSNALGTYIFSDPGNRFAVDEPITFERGANPVETSELNVFKWGTPQVIRAEAWSDAPRAGGRIATVHGQPHTVFKLNSIPNIGYVVSVKDPGRSDWLPLNDNITDPDAPPGGRITFQSPTGGPGLCCSIGLVIRLTFIKLGQPSTTLPLDHLYSLRPVSFRVLRADGSVFGGPVSAEYTFKLSNSIPTCTKTGATTQSIHLPNVPLSAFPTVGSTYEGNQEASFSLQCGAGVTVYATLTDANNTSNRGDILTNTGSAKGMGVQLLQTSTSYSTSNCSPGTPCKFGPDSPNKGNTNQWQIGPDNIRNPDPTNPSVSFRARYIRTGSLQPGDVRAVSTITFSYQ